MKQLDEIINGDEAGSKDAEQSGLNLSKEQRKEVLALVEKRKAHKNEGKAITDDINAVAKKLGLKSTEFKEVMAIVETEQEVGGAVIQKEKLMSLAVQVLEEVSVMIDNAPNINDKK